MESVQPTAGAVVSQDLPEPTSYRGQYVMPLDVDPKAWLRYSGITYWLDPAADPNTATVCYVYLLSDSDLKPTCVIDDESGRRVETGVANDGDLQPRVIILKQDVSSGGTVSQRDTLPGTSLTFRINYQGSQEVNDVVVPIDFGRPVAEALGGRKLYFKLSEQPTAFTDLAARDRLRSPKKTPLIYLHGYEDPDTGQETIGTRLPPIALTRDRIAAAWNTGKATGVFDPAVFPNVPADLDAAGRAGLMAVVAGLDEATVVEQVHGGARLVINRAATGEYTYRFLPAPRHCSPGLVLVEYYRLTSFPARYGAGRTIKTFTLLPGERTSIRISSYLRSAESQQRTASILDATDSQTESEFARTVNSEQSNQDSSSKSFEYRAEAEAQGQANWGWGSASAKVSGGVSGGSNSAREEFVKNLTNAVSQNTARASSRREMQVDTSIDVKLETGEEQAVERMLENINVSRTLNFVFRQMNQEYFTVLHLVDVRVAFFNGHAESRDEVPLSGLDRLLADCLQPEAVDSVRSSVLEVVKAIPDYQGRVPDGFVKQAPPAPGQDPATDDLLAVDPNFTSTCTGPDGREHTVPGVIVGLDQHVLRTDGITVDSYLGDGNALDDYSTGLQEQAVRARQIDNDRAAAEVDRLRLATQLVQDGNTTGAALYQRLFPIPQIVNQIDHAAVGAVPNGQQPTGDGVPAN
ncbi:MAG TPA: hypothetical protein VFV01_29750 [Spirillospora sp.]|nr:hypothetical protein [Spirillospora sp.]